MPRTTVAIPQAVGHSAIRAGLRRAAEWIIVHPRVLAGLPAPLPAGVVFLAQTAMGVAIHSAIAAAIRLVASRVAMRPEVSPVVIHLGVSRVVVTEAAEAADKSQNKLP